MNCALCARPAPDFTMCDYHRQSLGVSVRRKRGKLPRRCNPLPPSPNRPPRPCRTSHYQQITHSMIRHIRAWYEVESLGRVARDIGVEASTVRRLIRAVPGDPIRTRTYDLILAWMGRKTMAREAA